MDSGIDGSTSSSSSSASTHEHGAAHAKRPAGRTKFKETRHPVYRGVRRRGSAGRWVCEVRVPGKRGERLWLGTYVKTDEGVILDPLRIGGTRVADDVIGDAVLAESKLKHGAPRRVVGWVEGENERYVLVDVDTGQGRGRGRGRRCSREDGRRRRRDEERGRRRRHGRQRNVYSRRWRWRHSSGSSRGRCGRSRRSTRRRCGGGGTSLIEGAGEITDVARGGVAMASSSAWAAEDWGRRAQEMKATDTMKTGCANTTSPPSPPRARTTPPCSPCAAAPPRPPPLRASTSRTPDSAWLLVVPPWLADLADVRRAAVEAVAGFMRREAEDGAVTVVPVDEATSTRPPDDMFELDMSGEIDLDTYYAGLAEGMLLEPPPTPYWENRECGAGDAALWSY
ncbi:unnamed protein product [Alopecurus aequalis]